MPYTEQFIEDAHQHCLSTKKAVLEGGRFGCFYCLHTFDASEVKEIVLEKAMCPGCGLPTVLPGSAGLPVDDPEFLTEVKARWIDTGYTAQELKAAREEGREPVPVRF